MADDERKDVTIGAPPADAGAEPGDEPDQLGPPEPPAPKPAPDEDGE
jgi:hypothetical protein